MHKITLQIEGTLNDSETVELADPEAFALYLPMKTTLRAGAPPKRRARRGSATSNEETGELNAAGETEEA